MQADLTTNPNLTTPPPPLQVESLVKRFGQTTAVKGVSLAVRGGECLGLLGPNGAGKSTLIRSIVGRVIPDAGRVAVFGSPASSTAARMALGWVPQELAIYPRISCRENLGSFGRYYGLSGGKLAEAIAWCLQWAALEDRSADLAGNLSGGMKRRLNMAAGMLHRPKIVLFDEPTVGVDPQSRNRIFEMIESLRTAGTAIIYTTHYMEEAERLCDRIAIIDHGCIIASGTRDELIQSAFGTRTQVQARFAGAPEAISAWTARHRGRLADATAEFTIEHSSDIAALLDDASKAGLELVDVSLRRPNLESVFLHLTGRELRD
ncbi:MAG TPA: ABC transporter ATP-binding protein [Terracidiphilus sp.]|nr:ABC transporter ATP-binding protein [Terracidiphilus sp.]